MGGTKAAALDNTGHFGNMASLIALKHPYVFKAVQLYFNQKAGMLIDAIVNKRKALVEQKSQASVVMSATPKKRKSCKPTKEATNRPTSAEEALFCCLLGWTCFESKHGFIYKNKITKEMTYNLLEDETPAPKMPPVAAAPSVLFCDQNDDNKDNDDGNIVVTGTKTTSMDNDDGDIENKNNSDDDEMRIDYHHDCDHNLDDNNGDDIDNGSSNTHKPLSDTDEKDDNNFGLS